MANNFADDVVSPVSGASERLPTYRKAVAHYDNVVCCYSPADSTIRNALLDMNRAQVEIRLKDGVWPDHPTSYDGVAQDPGPAY